jgi:hypothetical protein
VAFHTSQVRSGPVTTRHDPSRIPPHTMPLSIARDSVSVAIDGYAIAHSVISREIIVELIDTLAESARQEPIGLTDRAYAIRNLLGIDQVRRLANSPALRRLIEPHLGVGAHPVRGILFDKTRTANWKVAWHQDRSIAVKQRIEVPGYGPWSVKAGVQHVQPPIEVLDKMLTLRLHLDDCGEDNGPLCVIPGSHTGGILSDETIAMWRSGASPAKCICQAGGAVLMRPLLLHASASARLPGHRRVIHIEYAAALLAGGLEWFEAPKGRAECSHG